MFVDKLVTPNDPYKFRLLVIRSCNADMRKTMLIMDIDNVASVGECTREGSDWFTKKKLRVVSLVYVISKQVVRVLLSMVKWKTPLVCILIMSLLVGLWLKISRGKHL